MAKRSVPVVEVLITSPSKILYQGTAASVVFPGEQGTFEVMPLHRPLVSRLRAGRVFIDGKGLMILRGIVRVADDLVTAVVELP